LEEEEEEALVEGKRNDILGEKRREKYTLSTDFGILRVVVVKKWQPPKSTKPVDIIICRIIFFSFLGRTPTKKE